MFHVKPDRCDRYRAGRRVARLSSLSALAERQCLPWNSGVATDAMFHVKQHRLCARRFM
jgi:hypothetical protein